MNIDYFWEGDNRWNPYFIDLSGTIVGFVVVLFENMDIDPDPTHVIYDFMILQKHRRKGLGYCAAKNVFELFNANWAVAQMGNNDPALHFWRKVIRDFTDHNYIESRHIEKILKNIYNSSVQRNRIFSAKKLFFRRSRSNEHHF
ncbi:GNAT family N-acetyltransferase [Paenibacillus sp. QZ-Y1]|uniref:GNAT family N-acetyltransferase n=1 Tax=Paenibacillus sp. QZ-Y1 TaxID=3414511 RepID=UPI003F794C4F